MKIFRETESDRHYMFSGIVSYEIQEYFWLDYYNSDSTIKYILWLILAKIQ